MEKASEFIEKWLENSDKKGAANKDIFNNMPSLDKDSFAKFYNYWVTGVSDFSKSDEKGGNISYFTGEDATKDAGQLVKEVNFDLSGKIEKVPWL